jgi:DNA segregation ATPase FtsK/SpoIIIE-like protein
LAAFSYLPHLVKPVASSLPEAIQALDFLVWELEYRQNNDVIYPKILLIVNNLDELLVEGQRALMNRLICLLQYGVEVGIHVVLSLAYPGGEFVDNILKCDFPLRFIGRVENEKLARAASGVNDTEAHTLVGMGDFVAVHAGQMVRFRTAEIGDYDLFLAVEKLSRQKKRRILARTADFRVGFLGAGM